MYCITYGLHNSLNCSYIKYLKNIKCISSGLCNVKLRCHGTLHWKDVDSPKQLLNLCSNVVKESSKILNYTFQRKNPSPVELLEGIDHVSNMLCLLADPAELVRTVHPELDWRHAADEVVNQVTMMIEKVNMNSQFYNTLVNSLNQWKGLTFEQQKVLSHMINSMRDHGVHLTDTQKNDYLKLLLQERELSQKLIDQNHKYIKLPRNLIPFDYINSTEYQSNELLVDYSFAHHIMKSSPIYDNRKQIYHHIMSKSQPLDQSLLKLTAVRHKMAKMRQFPNYASLSLRDNILSSTMQVEKYLSNLLQSTSSLLLDELDAISQEVDEINPWDLDFLLTKFESKHAPNEVFTFNSLMDFFRKIVKSLFRIQVIESNDNDSWSDTLKFHFVRDNVKLCTLYLDIFNREEKNGVFAQFTLKCSKLIPTNSNNNLINSCLIENYFNLTDGQDLQYQTPSTAVVCNFPKQSPEIHLDTNQAVMLFHELGHTLHTLLSCTTYQHLSGNRGGVDFAEFSSHLFEYYPRKFLTSQNGIRLQYIEFVKMAIIALADQVIYSKEWHDFDQLVATIRDRLLQYPSLNQSFKGKLVLDIFGIPNLSKFDHLVHYGGTYYCYLYSRSLAGMIWKLAAEGNEFSSTFGTRLNSFFSKGSIDSSIRPILDICDGSCNILKCPEEIDPKYTFV